MYFYNFYKKVIKFFLIFLLNVNNGDYLMIYLFICKFKKFILCFSVENGL